MEADGPVTAGDVAARVHLARPTAYRFLSTFQKYGMAESREGGGFCPGHELYRLAALLHQSYPLEIAARPMMRELAEATGETSLVAAYRDFDQKIVWELIERGTKPSIYTLTHDRPTTPVWGASGRVIMAHLADQEVEQILARDRDELSPTLGTHPPEASELRLEFADIHRKGYATSLGQRVPHAFSIAAPLFRAGGYIAGALSLSIPEMRAGSDVERALAPLVMIKARELSAALGAGTPLGAGVQR